MNKNMPKILLLLCLFVSFGSLNAQSTFKSPEEELGFYTSKYPDQSAIVLKHHKTMDLSVVGDSIVVKGSDYEEILYLKDNATSYAKGMLYSSSFVVLSNINAYSLLPGKKKYEKSTVDQFNESYDKDSYVFYDDQKEITYYFPGLVKGAKSVMAYDQTITDPHLVSNFYFQTYLPIVEIIYTVIYDNTIGIKPHLFNDDTIEIIQQSETIDNRVKLTFKATQVPEMKFESNSPAFGYFTPSVFIQIENFVDSKGSKNGVLASTDDLYLWYQTFISALPKQSEVISAFLPEIINNADDELTKLKKIYYWVQANIKYIAFEQGMRGLIPHSGEYVLEKRYGDCKDMSSLLVSLLQAAGLNAKYTWIGTRDIPHKYSETPSPIVDNHMIATCQISDKTYFLDATGQYTPLNYPTSMIQSKECLVGDGENYQIIEVPVVDKSENIMKDEHYVELNNGIVSGKGEVTLTGYAKVFNAYKLVKANSKSKDDYLNRVLSKGSNKFLSKNYQIQHLEDFEKPILINYDFVIKDYYNTVGNDIYINLVLDKSLVDDLIKNRKSPIENEYKYTNTNITHVTLPAGYSASFIPKNESMNGELFGFDIQYQLKENQLIVTKTFYVDYLIMYPDQFENWNTAIKKYSDTSRQVVILSKTK